MKQRSSARPRRAGTAARPRARRPHGLLQLHAPPDTPSPRWVVSVGWAVLALAALALLWTALRLHRVGDYFTESDFYGGYAEGARWMQQGRVDPARYAVVGPVYAAVLALLGAVAGDLFLAGRLVSVAAACGTLLLWWKLLERRVGAVVGLWTVAFLAVNPVFFRYGYSATTDMLANFLQTAALFALLGMKGPRAPLWAGLAAALAFLTRYNAAYLVPAGILCAAWLARAPGTSRRRAVALFLAAFALVAGAWFAYSLASGHLPGAELFSNLGFYTNESTSRNVQDDYGTLTGPLSAPRAPAAAAPARLALAERVLRNVPGHLAADARDLLGWPLAALCLAGLILALWDGSWRALVPLWAAGSLLFATLLPVFYSDRYSMPLAPVYLALAGAAVASPRLALGRAGSSFNLKWVLALILLALLVPKSIAYQKRVLGQMPIEVIEAGRALRRVAPPGARIVSRKAHIAYYGGVEPVPFPRLRTLAELAAYCERQRAEFLYFSWYEGELRPEFWYLLDTTGTVPGLSVTYACERNPAVVYRIGPAFGRDPEWFADDTLRRVHVARAVVKVLTDQNAWPHHLLLAVYDLQHGRAAEALVHAEAAARIRPEHAAGWSLQGDALRLLARPAEAIVAYERGLARSPRSVPTRIGLGQAQMDLGRTAEAAGTFRPVLGGVEDRPLLRRLVLLYDQLGDRDASATARARLARGAP
jgi:hypothetical protein